MALLGWKPEYAVGDAEIDADHRHLFELVNAFHEAFTRNRDRREILRVLNALVSYSEAHFRREEAMMAEREMPGLEEHRRLHVRLFEKIFELQKRFEEGSLRMDQETVEFLRTWLTDHIVGCDAYANRRERGGAKPKTRAAAWHEVLQVPADASMQEITQAYRRRMSEYHPDKVAPLGEELRQVAERRTKEINLAYEEATRQRGPAR